MMPLAYFTRFVQLLQGQLLLKLSALPFRVGEGVTITNMYTALPQTALIANMTVRRPSRNPLYLAD